MRARLRVEVAPRTEHRNPLRPHGLQVRASRQQVHLRAAAVQRRPHIRADRPGPHARHLHEPPPTSPARLRGCGNARTVRA